MEEVFGIGLAGVDIRSEGLTDSTSATWKFAAGVTTGVLISVPLTATAETATSGTDEEATSIAKHEREKAAQPGNERSAASFVLRILKHP